MKPSQAILSKITTYREGEVLCCMQCKDSLFQILKYLDDRLGEEDPQSASAVDLVAAFGRAAEHFKKQVEGQSTWQQKVFEAVRVCTSPPVLRGHKDYGEWRRKFKNWIFSIVEEELQRLNKSWEERINERIDHYLENCKKAQAEGAGSQFGSASGSIMLSGAMEAFKNLRKELLQNL